MHIKKFTHKVHLRQLNNEYNSFVKKSTWERPKNILLELTQFTPIHRVDSGRNGVNTLLELQTKVIEVNELLIDRPYENSLNIYIKTRVKTDHGFGRYEPYYIKLRKNKKECSFSVIDRWESNDINVDSFKYHFGYELPGKSRDETEKEYRDIIRFEFSRNEHNRERFEKLSEGAGFEIIKVFQYSEQYTVYPKYTVKNKNSFELGFETHETYNSLPVTLKISKVTQIKTVSLADIGVEGSGYYSHDDRMKIRPEAVKEAVKFNKAFNRKKNTIPK